MKSMMKLLFHSQASLWIVRKPWIIYLKASVWMTWHAFTRPFCTTVCWFRATYQYILPTFKGYTVDSTVYYIYIYILFTKITTATKNVTTQLFHLAWVPHIGAKSQHEYSLLYAIHVSSFHLEGMSKPISPLASPQWPITIFLDISWPYTTLHHTITQQGHQQCWSDFGLTICLLMVYLKRRCHINCMVGEVFYVINKVT